MNGTVEQPLREKVGQLQLWGLLKVSSTTNQQTFFTLAPREGLDNVVGGFSISDSCACAAKSFPTVGELSKQCIELLPCFLPCLVAAG